MAFLEIKGMLARLLATENLTVEHSRSAKTATFNVASRVMTLPVWNTESEEVYNLFVSHEVGHALWTPTDFPERLEEAGVNASLVNVIEDVRIEKLIQKKFPGLRKDYSRGYREIYESGLFTEGQLGKDISEYNLIDRINLHYKVGATLLVPFTDEEKKILDLVENCDDYDDVITTTKTIETYVERNPHCMGDLFSGDATSIVVECEDLDKLIHRKKEFEDLIKSEGPENEDEAGSENGETYSPPPEFPLDTLKSETQQALDAAMERMVAGYCQEFYYLKASTRKPKDYVWPTSSIRDGMDQSIVTTLKTDHNSDKTYNEFMIRVRRDVNHMVQQFEMKRSAEVYARVHMNKTGMLNSDQLHNYKLTDDIFLRQEITPDGKSHGMVMLLDWSGSMTGVALETIKQILVLVQFCRKVQIPFRVYTFTTGRPYNVVSAINYREEPCDRLQMIEVLNSSTKKGQLDKDMYNLYLIGFGKKVSSTWNSLDPCSVMSMGGTPLINSLFLSVNILKEFKEQTKVDKISFVVITDGESARLTYTDSEGQARTNYGGSVMIRGENGTVYKIDDDYRKAPGEVAQWITTVVPNVHVTNIFLGVFGACNKYHRSIIGYGCFDEQNTIKKVEFNKHNGLHFTTKTNWPLVALMNPTAFHTNDDEMEIEDGASAAKVKSAFKKFLHKKTGSKKVLTAIVDSFA